jgi:hypothetical protein
MFCVNEVYLHLGKGCSSLFFFQLALGLFILFGRLSFYSLVSVFGVHSCLRFVFMSKYAPRVD